MGATIRAFSEVNVVEKAGIHYPCFGQRSAFFASDGRTHPFWDLLQKTGRKHGNEVRSESSLRFLFQNSGACENTGLTWEEGISPRFTILHPPRYGGAVSQMGGS
jgi:hypothetical protein